MTWMRLSAPTASIAAYREMYGYDHPDDPIGPEPARQAPDQRAAWHEAFAALGPAGQPDVRVMPDGQLWLARDAYAAETAWAPPYAGKELRLSRLGAFDAALGVIRADAETAAARKAGDHDRAARHEHLAASYQALRDHYLQQAQALTQAMAARQDWKQATEQSRRLALAADAELRRRHPGRKIEPLRSAEPAPARETGCEPLHPAGDDKLTETAALMRDLAVQREEFRAEMDERPWLVVPGGTMARPSALLRRPARKRFCSHPNRRSPPRPGSSSSPQSTTSNPRLEANHR